MEIIMSDEPYLVIDWTGASELDKEKALSGINAAFAAIGATAAHGAMASFAREGDELNYMAADDPETAVSTVTSAQHEAANLWDGMERLAVAALGKDPDGDRLPDFLGRIEPWVSEAQVRQMTF